VSRDEKSAAPCRDRGDPSVTDRLASGEFVRGHALDHLAVRDAVLAELRVFEESAWERWSSPEEYLGMTSEQYREWRSIRETRYSRLDEYFLMKPLHGSCESWFLYNFFLDLERELRRRGSQTGA
jgi:hypothetical protein